MHTVEQINSPENIFLYVMILVPTVCIGEVKCNICRACLQMRLHGRIFEGRVAGPRSRNIHFDGVHVSLWMRAMAATRGART